VKVTATSIPEVLLIEPKVFGDARGFFFESFNQRAFEEAVGRPVAFVQDNHSLSSQGVLRGLHYQIQKPQGKLVRVVRGEVFDVAVDMRRKSPTFGRWAGARLSAEFLYKTTNYYAPEHERCVMWNDAQIGIDWAGNGFSGAPSLSAKDAAGLALSQADTFD